MTGLETSAAETAGLENGIHESGRRTVPTAMELLVALSRLYKIQPATALWRAVEIREVLKHGLPEGTGLDLGCGDGALTGIILGYLGTRPELIGLDYDAGEIRVAERRGVYARTVCAGGEAIPLGDATIDFVFSNSVLEHIPRLEDTLAECARILRPGGALIATVPAPGFHDLLRARGRSGAKRKAYLERMDARLAHFNYFGSEGWSDLFARHGMKLDMAKGYLSRAQVQRWERLSGLTAGILQSLGASNALLYRLQRLTRADDKLAGGSLDRQLRPAAWSHLWSRIVAGRVLDRDGSDDGQTACLLIRASVPET